MFFILKIWTKKIKLQAASPMLFDSCYLCGAHCRLQAPCGSTTCVVWNFYVHLSHSPLLSTTLITDVMITHIRCLMLSFRPFVPFHDDYGEILQKYHHQQKKWKSERILASVSEQNLQFRKFWAIVITKAAPSFKFSFAQTWIFLSAFPHLNSLWIYCELNQRNWRSYEFTVS